MNYNGPLHLIKNRTYPSYQLYATIENKKTAPEDAFKIAVLTAIGWLREKFSNLDMPEELQCPSPHEYAELNLNELKSFRLDCGYVVDVVYISEIKNWSLQLVEPDLGLSKQQSNPVPGRIFTTNIGFRLVDDTVECGFNTLVSDPETVTEKCSVFRLGVVKLLVRNPMLGLQQCTRIIEHADTVDTSVKVRSLKDLIADDERTLPLAVFTMVKDGTGEKTMLAPNIDIMSLDKYMGFRSTLNSPVKNALSGMYFTVSEGVWNTEARIDKPTAENETIPSSPKTIIEAEAYLPYDIKESAHTKMGYGHYYVIAEDKLTDVCKLTGVQLKQGDVCVIEPKKFGGRVTVYPYSSYRNRKSELIAEVDSFIQSYSMDKPMTFGKVLFSPDARMYQQEQLINSTKSRHTLLDQSREHERLLMQKHNEELQMKDKQIYLLNEKIGRLQQLLDEKNTVNAELRRAIEQLQINHEKNIRGLEEKLEFIDSLKERPTQPADVPKWVEKKFAGRMIFHQRAVDLISAVPSYEVDMELLCDALEYLATEYYDFYTKVATEDEIMQRSSTKYNRPFKVTPTGYSSIEYSPIEYKVKYNLHGSTSKQVALDMHLKAGVSTQHLIRIYFFYDSYNRYFVVGSLPKHLKTVTEK